MVVTFLDLFVIPIYLFPPNRSFESVLPSIEVISKEGKKGQDKLESVSVRVSGKEGSQVLCSQVIRLKDQKKVGKLYRSGKSRRRNTLGASCSLILVHSGNFIGHFGSFQVSYQWNQHQLKYSKEKQKSHSQQPHKH